MKWRDLLGEWGLSRLQLKLGFLEAEFQSQDVDRRAAWELYVELATRITTQTLDDAAGVDRTALESVYSLFPATRTILRQHGPSAQNFARVAIAVLNVVLRPFLSKWHLRLGADGQAIAEDHTEFRADLRRVRAELMEYAAVLARVADVEQLA
jgi:hypothetical protein